MRTVLLADIVTGKTGLAEVMFLVALILAGIAGVASVMAKSIWSALICFAIAFVALGFFVL